VAHICILVKDIEKAVKDYAPILKAFAPDMLERKVAIEERYAGNDKYVTAFYGASGDGCDIQFLQPPAGEESPLQKRLEKAGEGIHHIAFASSHLEDTYQALVNDGVSVNDHIIQESLVRDGQNDVRHFWILPKYSHGVLIEVIDQYNVQDSGLIKKAD
jgi:hypothetical protein